MQDASIVNAISRLKGAYILQIRVLQDFRLPLRRLDEPVVEAGLYLYCGSANGPGGIAARVKRHLKRDKKPHWHVDHLSIAFGVEAFCTFEGGCECDLVSELLQNKYIKAPYAGVGSSDCRRCFSHLLRLPDGQTLENCGVTPSVFRPVRGRVF